MSCRNLLLGALLAVLSVLAAPACIPVGTALPPPVALDTYPPYLRETGLGEYLSPVVNPIEGIPESVVVTTGVVYAPAGSMPGSGDMKLDIYLNATTPTWWGSRPTVIWFHGAGGSKARHDIAPMVWELLYRGFIVVSAEYSQNLHNRGLAPETPITQAKAAVRFVKGLAATSPIYNPERVYVAGVSFGAMLASMVGLTPGSLEPPGSAGSPVNSSVRGVVALQPAADLGSMVTWAEDRYSEPPYAREVEIVKDTVKSMFSCKLPSDQALGYVPCTDPSKQALLSSISPITHAATGPGDVGFYVLTGTADMITQSVPQGREFTAALGRRSGDGREIWGDVVGGTHFMNTWLPFEVQFVGSAQHGSANMAALLPLLGCVRTYGEVDYMIC